MAVSAPPIRVAAKLAVVAQPRVGALDDPAQSESEWLFDRRSRPGPGAPLNVEIAEAAIGELVTDFGIVVATVEVQGLDLVEQSRPGDVVKGGRSILTSLRLAPSMAQPIGMPWASVAMDHFHPNLARSVGFLPVPSPPQGALCNDPSSATSERSRPMMRS